MDEIALLRALPPEGESPDTARAAALQALEASFERAAAAAAAPRTAAPSRTSRRGVFAFAAAGATAAVLASVLLVSSGPRAEPAVAEVLRDTAAVAAADHGYGPMPGPGEFLYMKAEHLELLEWVPGSYAGSYGGVSSKPEGAYSALVPWQEEIWASRYEQSRHRWVMGDPRFLSSAERSRWERAGSPVPALFEGGDAGRGVRDVEGADGHGFRDFSALPTEPEALRLAIESLQGGRSLDTGRVIGELWDILDKPNTTPALRAAVFGALAEVPGIELDRDAVDLAGRPGYALRYEGSASGFGATLAGLRVEYVFDPETSAILGRREVVADPGKISWLDGIPAGTVRREVTYLQSEIVDSTRERPGALPEPATPGGAAGHLGSNEDDDAR